MCLQGALSIKELLCKVREALQLEKEAHARTRQELDELKHLYAAETGVHPNVVGPNMDRLSPTVPSRGIAVVEPMDNAEGVRGLVGDLLGKSVPGEGVGTRIMEPCVQDFWGEEMLRTLTYPLRRG